jgi:hypothetical protein
MLPRALRQPSPLFCEYILEHPVIEGEIGDRRLEPAVLIFELLQTPRFVDIETAILSFPSVISLFADAVGAASVIDSLPGFNAFEDVDDLLFVESGLTHLEFSSSVSLRENSHYPCTFFGGGGHPFLQQFTGNRVLPCNKCAGSLRKTFILHFHRAALFL